MFCIKEIVDEDFGIKSKEFNDPRIRYGARGIIINNDTIAVFNKSKKNEYKLPGGGIDAGEDPKTAFKREAMEETGCEIEIIEELGLIKELKSNDNFIQTSYVFVAKVINQTNKLDLTQKEQAEGAKLLWCKPMEAYNLISECINNLKSSAYENVYHSKFIVKRDAEILKYYFKKEGLLK